MELQCFFEVVYGFHYVPCKFEKGTLAKRELRSCLKKSEIWFFVFVFFLFFIVYVFIYLKRKAVSSGIYTSWRPSAIFRDEWYTRNSQNAYGQDATKPCPQTEN